MSLLDLDYNPNNEIKNAKEENNEDINNKEIIKSNSDINDNFQINLDNHTNLIKNPIGFNYFEKEWTDADEYFKNTSLKVFIMTCTGKPIYCRNFLEDDINSLMAALNLIINKSKISYDLKNELTPNYFITDTFKCVFLVDKNLYYVITDSKYNYEIFTLKIMIKHLQNYIYLNIIDHFFDYLNKNISFDILNKSIIYKKEIDYCIMNFTKCLRNQFSLINIFPIFENHRKKILDILKNKNEFKWKKINDNILVTMITSSSSLIAYNSFDGYILNTNEINLLMNLSNFYIKTENKLYYKKIVIPTISTSSYLSFSCYCFNNYFHIITIAIYNEEIKKDIEYYNQLIIEKINKNSLQLILNDYYSNIPISFFSIKIENLKKAIIIDKKNNMMSLIGFKNYNNKLEKIKNILSIYNTFKIYDEDDKNYSVTKIINSKIYGIFNKDKVIIIAISVDWVKENIFNSSIESLLLWIKNDYENLFFKLNK